MLNSLIYNNHLFIISEDLSNLISSVWHKVMKNFVVVVIALIYSFTFQVSVVQLGEICGNCCDHPITIPRPLTKKASEYDI